MDRDCLAFLPPPINACFAHTTTRLSFYHLQDDSVGHRNTAYMLSLRTRIYKDQELSRTILKISQPVPAGPAAVALLVSGTLFPNTTTSKRIQKKYIYVYDVFKSKFA